MNPVAAKCHVKLFFAAAPSHLGAMETEAWPIPQWKKVAPDEVGMTGELLDEARHYALSADASGSITRQGKLVMSWGDPRKRFDLKSSTKSFGSIALGLPIDDGRIQLDDLAIKHHPRLGVPPAANSATGWLDEVTIKHLAPQTAGFEKPGGYTPQQTDSWDVGPGDSASFPTKWISADGRAAHLVFSGDDSFSVRQAEFAVP